VEGMVASEECGGCKAQNAKWHVKNWVVASQMCDFMTEKKTGT